MAIWDTFTNQKQWELYLKQLVKENDKALLKALLLVYENQTNDERNVGNTVHKNKIGFSKPDAHELTRLALKVKRDIPLGYYDMWTVRNKMGKYWRQLMVASKAKQKRLAEQAQPVDNKCPCDNGICDECAEGSVR